MISLNVHPTRPSNPKIERQRFPETDTPQICIAFLSCCGRTDLLNHTIAAAIRHLEQDEPDGFRYEIAWVDNGSGYENTKFIEESYQIDHALPLEKNYGLAYGMNLLIFNLCTAPYILLMEEDWLYLDDLVAEQTEKRKRAISTAIALTKSGLKADDGRDVMGVFLRPETYHSFLKEPNVHPWQTKDVDLNTVLASDDDNESNDASCDETNTVSVDYQIFCAERDPTKQQYVWGSYTNGVGLYSREKLMKIGRMNGEPEDIFNTRYIEPNYAYRALQNYCHAAIRLDDDPQCMDIGQRCTAAFYHIGGGRGTIPMKADGSKCAGYFWIYYGTPMFEAEVKNMERNGETLCTESELMEWKSLTAAEKDSADYREETARINKEVFEKERQQREQMIQQGELIKQTDPSILRVHVPNFAEMSDSEIMNLADKMIRFANSPHPIQGYWDSHGRPIQT